MFIRTLEFARFDFTFRKRIDHLVSFFAAQVTMANDE